MDLEWMEEDDQDEQEEEKEEVEPERSRPTTPKWWRPPIPPETYMWEEIRRKRKKGGYPWTLLDKDDELYDEDDNLYEPVNPPPLYGSGSRYMSKDQTDTGSLDGRMLDIPPDIELLTSEGLDGLDQPDPHDRGVDGDKEWHHFHHEDDQGQPVKATFTAGLRKEKRPKHRSKAEGSNMRPLTNKNITFAPEANPGATGEEGGAQEVPTAEPGPSHQHRVSPLDQLKAKAEQAAGQVKQRISKISIPVRPKFNNWTGIKLAKKKPKEKRKAEDVEQEMEEEEQQVPDDEGQEPLAKRKLEEIETVLAPIESVPEPEVVEVQQEPSAKQKAAEKAAEKAALKAEEKAKKDKEMAEEKARKEKEAAEEKARVDKERAEEKARVDKERAEEKARKDKEHAEEKARKEKEQAEEKARKDKEQEEIKKAKAEEKLAKEKAKEEQKRLKAEEKLQKQEEAKRLKLEAELKKAAEQEELKRLKADEEELKALQHQEEEEQRTRDAEEGDVEMEDAEGHDETPGGTRSRRPKKKMYRPNLPQLPHLPNLPTLPQIDLKKRFIRHKSPESRPSPTRAKKRMGLENLLGIQYSDELRSRELEMEDEHGDRLREPKIFVTQASVETESEVPTDYSRTGASVRSEEFEEAEDAVPVSKQAQAQEKLEKIGKSLKGFGIKSKAIASQKSKEMGQKMKVLGKDIHKFGVKVNEKCQATIEEIKAKQEAARNKKREAEGYEGEGEEGEMELEAEAENREVLDMEETEPRTTFRFRRRTEEQIEQEKKSSSQGVDLNVYENDTPAEVVAAAEEEADGKFARCQLLGRADRDWESPLDLVQSRDASEEPFSGNVSSRDSPPGSSMASSSIMQVRRQGVLEEIDSDEFFLRERGISEGEDEEEVNRFLVEELRQAFRPTMANALAGFDLPAPPSRPTRSPRKPPRKEKERGSPNFQTFPPERPRRKQTPGYVSSYMNEHGEEEEEEAQREEELEEEEVKKEGATEDARRQTREILEAEDEDEGSYEPVSDEPAKPERTKRKKPKVPEANQAFYYNTIAANEWMREVEEQIMDDPELAQLEAEQVPAAPKRERRRSERSTNVGADSDLNLADQDGRDSRQESTLREDSRQLGQADSESKMNESEVDLDDTLDYVDEAGYAIVHKDKEPPRTTPRKKKRGSNGGGSKGSSLKRKEQQSDTSGSGPLFFSLPRYTPRTFHIVPPTRPHRTYSTLRPKRPPRNKSKSNQNLVKSNSNTPTSSRRDRDSEEPRPSTAIGIMQGRPLPPPPRPERSPAPLNDLDQTSIERAVGVRHYANFEEQCTGPEVVEEVFTATNIPMLGRNREEEETEVSSLLANSDINVAVQTDPVQGDDYELNNVTSFEEEGSSRVDKLRNSESRIPSDDQEQELPEDKPPPRPSREIVSTEAEVPPTLQLQPTPDPEREINLQPTSTEPTSIEQTPAPAQISPPAPQIEPTPEPAPPEPTPAPAPEPTVIQAPAPAPIQEPAPTIIQAPAPAPIQEPAPTIIQAPAPIIIQAPAPTPVQAPPEPVPIPPAPQPQPPPAPVMMQPQFIFPTRLHLEELEVDVLRVIDLSAHSITVDHLQAPHLEVTSLTSSGPLTVDRIQAQTLNSDQVNCNNLSSDTVDLPSIPPPSFYQLASPESVVPEERSNTQELKLETAEQEDNENDCSCPEDIIIGQLSLRSAEELLASLTGRRETVVETSTRNIPLEEEIVEEEPRINNIPVESNIIEPTESLQTEETQETESAPREVTPVRSAPREITPVRSAPREVTPVRSAPREITPVRSAPREITPVRSAVSVEAENVSIPSRPARRTLTIAPVPAAVAQQHESEDIIQLSTRLCRALVKSTVRALQAMVDYIDTATSDDPSKAEQQKANMQVLLCIVLVLVAGMILTTRSDPPAPKWEFYMPPPDL